MKSPEPIPAALRRPRTERSVGRARVRVLGAQVQVVFHTATGEQTFTMSAAQAGELVTLLLRAQAAADQGLS